jgi:hypothetical protein
MMPSDNQFRNQQRIVTLNSIKDAATDADSAGVLERRESKEIEHRLLKARQKQILDKLGRETEKVGSTKVMIAVPDRDVSLMQSALARQADEETVLRSGGLEAKFGTGLSGGDWFGWLKSTLDWVDRADAHQMLRPIDAQPVRIDDDVRVAMAADWGTGLYGAPEIAKQIEKQAPFDLLLHLGDVYYAGTKDEVQARMLDLWPKAAGKMTRALNSNHEMYSGGYGYFDLEFKAFDQTSSYFAFQNVHWLLVCLDTAYVDHDIDNTQSGWLNSIITQAGTRKVVFFSHQQLFSRLDSQGPKLQKVLAALLESRLITAWYWGHEHQCVLYDPHPDYGLIARCLGNGGIPEPRNGVVLASPVEHMRGNISWRRLARTSDSPSCIVLDGPNIFIQGEEDKFVPHGFMTLDFKGPVLTERVFLADGTELFQNQII